MEGPADLRSPAPRRPPEAPPRLAAHQPVPRVVRGEGGADLRGHLRPHGPAPDPLRGRDAPGPLRRDRRALGATARGGGAGPPRAEDRRKMKLDARARRAIA